MSADRLADLILDFREELETEVPLRLHPTPKHGKSTKGAPADPAPDDDPADYVASGYRSAIGSARPLGWTGLPFKPAFQRYIGHPDEYGYEFIAAASFEEIRDYCRSKHHEEHHNPQPFGSLCKRMAIAIVELRQPLSHVASVEGLGIFAVRKHLEDVLSYAASWREQKKKMAIDHDTAADVPADPIGDMLRREHDEAHEERLWNRLRARYPKMPEWEVERARRIEEHRKLGCPRCMTIAA